MFTFLCCRGLGELESQKNQKTSEFESASAQTRLLETEMASYRDQVSDLKKEIDRVESDYRKQVTTETGNHGNR